MRIDGQWRLCDDGILRPVIAAEVLTASGSWQEVEFAVDSGADCSVFSADIWRALGLPAVGNAPQLGGVGGKAASVLIDARIQMKQQTGPAIFFNGRFAAFTDPAALDMSVLGRDITNLFALIVDRPQDIVCLIGQGHRYVIVQG